MVFNRNPLTNQYWFEDCPMLNPTFVDFVKSDKKYLFVFCDKSGEYLGEFYDEEPEEDLFVVRNNEGDSCGALFERDFSKKIDINNVDTIENALVLIDQYSFDD